MSRYEKALAALLGVLTPEERSALESAVPNVYRLVADRIRAEPGLRGATVSVQVVVRHPKMTGPIAQWFEVSPGVGQ